MGHGSLEWYTTPPKGYFPSECGYSTPGWVRDPKSTENSLQMGYSFLKGIEVPK